jgi:hypothetical protein
MDLLQMSQQENNILGQWNVRNQSQIIRDLPQDNSRIILDDSQDMIASA